MVFERVRIAFVDTGNSGRSVMAEALANAIIATQSLKVEVISRGVRINQNEKNPDTEVVVLLHQRGIDVAGHSAAQLEATDVRDSSLILTMTNDHRKCVIENFGGLCVNAGEKTFTLVGYATGLIGDIPDPYGEPMSEYIRLMLELDKLVPVALAKASVETLPDWQATDDGNSRR
jgi:protein-tyrosine phosphatase